MANEQLINKIKELKFDEYTYTSSENYNLYTKTPQSYNSQPNLIHEYTNVVLSLPQEYKVFTDDDIVNYFSNKMTANIHMINGMSLDIYDDILECDYCCDMIFTDQNYKYCLMCNKNMCHTCANEPTSNSDIYICKSVHSILLSKRKINNVIECDLNLCKSDYVTDEQIYTDDNYHLCMYCEVLIKVIK